MSLKKLDYNGLQTLVTAIKSYMRDNYLSLNGGIITGGITSSTSDVIKRDINTSSLVLYGGTNNSNSAILKLFGGEYDNNIKGWFSLKSQDGTNSKELLGKPDGTLTWCGYNVITSAGGTLTGAINTANNTWNKMGDDASIGDHNVGGKLCVKTQTSTATGIAFFNSSDTNVGQIEVNNKFNFNKTIQQNSKSVEAVNASGSDYIRYESGIQICWGTINDFTTEQIVTYPVAFIELPAIGISNGYCTTTLWSNTGTRVSLINAEHQYLKWVAIGKWK